VIRVTENLAKIKDLLAKSALDARRDPETVKLLAVSKKQPVDKILEAASSGQRDFGENFVQEGLEKIEKTRSEDLIWHFIGHLQANKTRDVAEHFDWVHTIDRLKTAGRLSRQRPAVLPPLNVCIQVNIDGEAGKSGVSPDELPDLATGVANLPNLRLRGLMCLPKFRDDVDEQKQAFTKLRELAKSLAILGIETDTLSMGMSDDFEAAIAEGATIVRIGTAIFGPRI
jgi:pyridoxal phosphate enzyme (YggS family)